MGRTEPGGHCQTAQEPVAPDYAPAGKTLIAVVVVDDEFRKRTDLEKEVRRQCREWFGDVADGWEHLRTYQIEHALPAV